jgi:hypothetical protein
MNSGVTVGQTIGNSAIVNYTAIITTNSAHGLAIGDIVSVNTGQTGIDGTWTVTSIPSATLFTFISTTQTLASGAITQGAFGKFPDVYTLGGSTAGIVTNIALTNPSAVNTYVTVTMDNQPVISQTLITANATTFLDLKQYVAASKKISVGASIPQVTAHISGITVA